MTLDRPDLVFVHPSDELYGADRMLLEILAAADPAWNVEVWLPTDVPPPPTPLSGILRKRGVAVRHLDLPVLRRAYQTSRGLSGLAVKGERLARVLRRVRPRTVYCTTSATFLAAPAARIAGVPHVLGHVQEIWSAGDRRMLGPIAGACQELIAISQPVVASLPSRLAARTTVVPNATPDPGPMESLAARTGPLRFVIASRWNAWKGHQTLFDAWDRLPEPGHLTVLGGPPPLGESVDVRGLVSQMRNRDTVSVVGEVDDAASFLQEADVAILPSDQPEPFGLVAIEAFARGRPVVGSAAGGLADIVTHDLDGWLFRQGDARALASLLATLDRSAVVAAGAQARKTYESRFTHTTFAVNWNATVSIGPRSAP